jgi:NAD+ synthase (glutamine-hydrolysing)
MRLIKLAAAVLNTTPLDWDGNRDRILAAVADAKRQGVSLLCLPELCITGYGCEDAFHSPGVVAMAWRVLGEILPSTAGMAVTVGLPLLYQNGLFNCAALLVDGKLVGLVAKQHLAGDGIHYEPRWFKPWPPGVTQPVVIDGRTVPMGDVYFDLGGIKIGFEICEDAWVATRPGATLAREGVDVLLNPSASHFAFGKLAVRQRLVIEGSRAFAVSYVYSNLLGNEAGRAIYDGGAMVASSGRMLAAGPRFSYADHVLTPAVVDVDVTRMAQARSASFSPAVGGRLDDQVAVPFKWPTVAPERVAVAAPTWEAGPHLKAEEFARAESLALFDYLRKSRSQGFVVSLSGGADSAAVVGLIAVMAGLAIADVGLAAVKKKLSYVKGIDGVTDGRSLVGVLLSTVYQSTANSGDVTRNAAKALAAGIGAEHHEFDVDALVKEYVRVVSGALGRPLTWAADDIALQNIQARARSPGVWMLTNLKNALLLSTSNRSEAAVGYATMDGDTSGGLSPVAGIDKHYLRQWLRWLETTGPQMGSAPQTGTAPQTADGTSLAVAALSHVNRQQPTAELRPAEQNQTDEADLMPYDLLDAVERAAIRDKQTPAEVLATVRVDFPQHTPAQLTAWVERFFRLWCRNQWKRERYAPSFHLDDENLDPKTWCRFPILSGGFERELAELRAATAG